MEIPRLRLGMTRGEKMCFYRSLGNRKKRCRMFKLRPSVAQGLPEGVLLYIEGRSWDREKGIPFSVCAFFTFPILSYLTGATYYILITCKFPKPHRTSCMELLSAYSNFRTKAKLKAISKAG